MKLVYAVGCETGILLFEVGMDDSVRFLTRLIGQQSPVSLSFISEHVLASVSAS